MDVYILGIGSATIIGNYQSCGVDMCVRDTIRSTTISYF